MRTRRRTSRCAGASRGTMGLIRLVDMGSAARTHRPHRRGSPCGVRVGPDHRGHSGATITEASHASGSRRSGRCPGRQRAFNRVVDGILGVGERARKPERLPEGTRVHATNRVGLRRPAQRRQPPVGRPRLDVVVRVRGRAGASRSGRRTACDSERRGPDLNGGTSTRQPGLRRDTRYLWSMCSSSSRPQTRYL